MKYYFYDKKLCDKITKEGQKAIRKFMKKFNIKTK